MGNYYAPFSLRVPEELIERIRKTAKQNKRSIDKELEFIIQDYVEKSEKSDISNKCE